MCFGTGETKYQEAMSDLTAKLNLTDKVRWMGTSSDLLSVYNALYLLVSSSTDGEGFGNIIKENMFLEYDKQATKLASVKRIKMSQAITSKLVF